MALLTLAQCKTFLDVDTQKFTISSVNDLLKMKYDSGSTTDVSLTDATYSGAEMATHLQTQIDSALSCSSAVSYSATTNKFTIAVSGHTMQYINSGSDAGMDLGFTEDSSDAESIISDTACGDATDIIDDIRGYVEAWATNYMRRDIESTSYTEYHNGVAGDLFLDHFPIISIARITTGLTDILKINNSGTYTYATVSVDSTNVTLNKDGTETEIALATYATMDTLATQISAQSGWTATVLDTTYSNHASNELVECFGINCLNTDYAYLKMRSDYIEDYSVDKSTGKIHYSFPSGYNNVIVNYTAGFSSTPEDVKLALLLIIKYLYDLRQEEAFGLSSYKLDQITKQFNSLPKQAVSILNSYKRVFI